MEERDIVLVQMPQSDGNDKQSMKYLTDFKKFCGGVLNSYHRKNSLKDTCNVLKTVFVKHDKLLN